MYCKIEGANTIASTGLKWNQPQDRPLTIHHLWPYSHIYIYVCIMCIHIYIYVYLPKHSPHASHPANLAPQAKSASSMYFLESSWAWSDNWSFYNIFGFSFNFLCCHRAEEQHELNLSLQIVWSPWVWIPGTVFRVLQTFKAWRSRYMGNGMWNLKTGVSEGSFISDSNILGASVAMSAFDAMALGDIMIDHERTQNVSAVIEDLEAPSQA